MVMEIPMANSKPEIFVHGAQVVVVWTRWFGDWGVQTFDFSRRGRSSLPLWGGVYGKTWRSTQYENRWDLRLERPGGMRPWNLESLGDGSLFYLVSCFSQSIERSQMLMSCKETPRDGDSSDVTLHVWELVRKCGCNDIA